MTKHFVEINAVEPVLSFTGKKAGEPFNTTVKFGQTICVKGDGWTATGEFVWIYLAKDIDDSDVIELRTGKGCTEVCTKDITGLYVDSEAL